jgi:hypothetical protein
VPKTELKFESDDERTRFYAACFLAQMDCDIPRSERAVMKRVLERSGVHVEDYDNNDKV